MAKVVIVQSVIPLYTASVFERLAALPGIDLTVLADLESSDQLNQYDPRIHKFSAVQLGQRKFGGFFLRPRLIRTLSALHPDVVVFNGSPREISQMFAAAWCRMVRIPVGIWSMFFRLGKPRLWTEFYLRVIGTLGNVLMSYGERGRREQIARGTPDEKIIVLSTAIDQSAVIQRRDEITEDETAAFRKKAGLEGKRVMLHVSRIWDVKRPDLMLQCFEKLTAMRDDVLLVWIGGGPLEAQTKTMAEKMGLSHRTIFVGPLYDEQELGLWYRTADVFVMAASIGLSIHHAMAYGLPVITDDDQLRQPSEIELLEDGITGLKYRAGDTSDFAAKINRLLNDEPLRQQLSANACEMVEKKYTMEKKIANFEAALKRLLKLRGIREVALSEVEK